MTEVENKLASTPITMDCFEMDDFFNMGIMDYEDITHEDCWNNLLQALEELRNKYNKTKDKRYWKELIRLLPNSYKCFNQLEKENAELKKENKELKKAIAEKNSEVEELKAKLSSVYNCLYCGCANCNFENCTTKRS